MTMFRDPLEASFRRTLEFNKSLSRMLEVQNGLARMAEIQSQPVHSAKALATRNQEMTKLLEEQARAAAEAHEAQSAAACVRRLEAQIRLFESELDADHDVGIRLVNFGSEITFQVTDIGSVEPDLIIFTGNVVARQNNSVQYADRLEVYLDEKGDKILRTVSTGSVRVVTRDCKTGTARHRKDTRCGAGSCAATPCGARTRLGIA